MGKTLKNSEKGEKHWKIVREKERKEVTKKGRKKEKIEEFRIFFKEQGKLWKTVKSCGKDEKLWIIVKKGKNCEKGFHETFLGVTAIEMLVT